MRSCSKKCITCVWVQSNRDHKALSMCGDIMFMRKNMMKELRQIIEANPVFRGKLKYILASKVIDYMNSLTKA
ncbi:hypothetical protein CerSpe_131810 [Prunus speciosa]